MARVDFYHLTRDAAPVVLPHIARRSLDGGARMVIVAADERLRATISDSLWSAIPESFLAHADSMDAADGGEGAESYARHELILLTAAIQASPLNGARFCALADGAWDDAALKFERAFLLFDGSRIEDARATWRKLGTTDGVERHYWKQDTAGRWKEGP